MNAPREVDDWLAVNDERHPATGESIAKYRLLWDHRKTILLATFRGLLAGLLIAFLIPVRYEGTAQLMPPDNQSGQGLAMLSAISGQGGGVGGVASGLLGIKNSGALFVGVFQSRTVADRLITQFDLRRVYHASLIEDARKSLASHTQISEDRKSGILAITVTDHDPKRAAAMAQAYVTELDRLVAEVSTSAARRERIFLEERLVTVKTELDASAQRFSQFASKNTAIDIPAQSKAIVEAASALQGQLIATESELRGLEAIYTSQNVRVRALRARVGELQAQLQKLGGDGPATSGAELSGSFYPSIRKLPLLGVTYADLYRQTKIQEKVYELLTQQYELAKVQEAKEIPSVKVLDAAVVPTKKSFPPRLLLTAIAGLLSLLASCAWLFAKRFWNGMDPQDPGRNFVLEIGTALRADLLHLAPEGSLRGRMLARLGLRSTLSAPPAPAANAEAAPAPSEIARAAGNTSS